MPRPPPLLSLLLAGAALAGPPRYTLTDLGTLGGRESRAYGLNSLGAACGEAATSQGAMQAFRWTAADGLRGLGTLGGPTSRGYGINDAGWVVGEAETTNGLRQPFCWTPETGLLPLPLPAGAPGGVAQAINASGQIAGAVDQADGPCAAFWPSRTNLPVLLTATGLAGLAFSLNDAGEVVGQSEMGEAVGRVTRAFHRTPDGVVAAISPLGEGLSSAARVINAAGQIAGSLEVRAGITHAFRYDTNGLADLDDRNNVFSEAHGLNARGDVVGTCFNGPDDDEQAFLWTEEGLVNLDDLLEVREPCRIVEAWAIHDDRRIVGCALKDERERAVLLTPVHGPGERLPTARILSPAAGTRLAPGQSLELEAVAAADDGVKRVTFVANGLVIGTATAAPYRLVWANPAAGDVDLVARVMSKTGRGNESGRVRIRVDLPANAQPVVTWRAPTNGAAVSPGSNVLFRAEARDPDGRVVAMELWRDGTNIALVEGGVLGEAWPAEAVGRHQFTAVAEDERGGRSTSEVLHVEVVGPAEAPGQEAEKGTSTNTNDAGNAADLGLESRLARPETSAPQ